MRAWSNPKIMVHTGCGCDRKYRHGVPKVTSTVFCPVHCVTTGIVLHSFQQANYRGR